MAFNSYSGCQKCTVRGRLSQQFRAMSFPQSNCPRRTNESFRMRAQEEHHHENRSLIELLHDVDMVADFPTSDPLHLLELGIMKRCLKRWMEGSKTYKRHLKMNDINQINLLLSQMRNEMPTEIHRAIRNLDTISFWKETEFRTFLLYIGIAVMTDFLTKEEYEHFKLLICSVILCSSDAYKSIVHRSILVDTLLGDYFEDYTDIYGEFTITSNVHNLCHLLEDIRRFGDLNTISTYPFENCLQTMKKKLRSANNPLQQIGRRFSEIEYELNCLPFTFETSKIHEDELKYPLKGHTAKFQSVILKDFRVSSKKIGDQWVMDKRNRIFRFDHAAYDLEGKIILHGYEIMDKTDFFTVPFHSSKISIYISDTKRTSIMQCKIEDIKCKMIRLSYKSKFVFQPLLHTLH